MKTIGQILNIARITKKHSLFRVEEMTKIKSGFIDAIEKEEWDSLPPFPTVLGFVKSISTTLEVDPKMAVAILKRDYPPKKLKVTPKPDVSSRFIWSPKLTFVVGVSGILFILFGYLMFQYIHFISSPKLNVDSPKDNQVIKGNSVIVFGSTDSDAKIIINGQSVIISDDGKFSVNLDIAKETREITIVASSRSGKTTTISRKISVL